MIHIGHISESDQPDMLEIYAQHAQLTGTLLEHESVGFVQ